MGEGYVGDEGGENQGAWLEKVEYDGHRQGEDGGPGGVHHGWHSLRLSNGRGHDRPSNAAQSGQSYPYAIHARLRY